MKILINEQLSPHKYKTQEGYLVCIDSVLARTGKQTYTRDEVFNDGEDIEVEVDRPEDEVFSPETLASFENKPLTLTHPDEDVTSQNFREYAVGFVRDIKKGMENGKPVMLGTLVITDAEAIEGVESGKYKDLSCGYDCDITDSDHPCQRNIRGNHIALCEQGRAGNARVVDSVKDKVSYSSSSSDDTYLATIEKLIYNRLGLKVDAMLFNYGTTLHISKSYKSKENLSENDLRTIKNLLEKEVNVQNISYSNPNSFDAQVNAKIVDSVKDVEPRAGEKKEEFISRFMSETKNEYPDEKQRYAVANSYWERKGNDEIKDNQMKTYTITWWDLINKGKGYPTELWRHISEIRALTIQEALQKLANKETFGIGTNNVMIVRVATNTTTYQFSGRLYTLLKQGVRDTMKDTLVDSTMKDLDKFDAIRKIKSILNNSTNIHEDSEGLKYLTQSSYREISNIAHSAKLTRKDMEEIDWVLFGPGGYYTIADSIKDKVIHKGNGEVHFFYRRNGKDVDVRVWNVHKLNQQEIDKISKKYHVNIGCDHDNDYCTIYSNADNIANVCRAFNEINPHYSVPDLLKMNTLDSVRDVDPYAKVTGSLEKETNQMNDFRKLDKVLKVVKAISKDSKMKDDEVGPITKKIINEIKGKYPNVKMKIISGNSNLHGKPCLQTIIEFSNTPKETGSQQEFNAWRNFVKSVYDKYNYNRGDFGRSGSAYWDEMQIWDKRPI